MTEQHKENRVAAAELNGGLTADVLNSVIWADEKSMPMAADAGVGWYDADGIDYDGVAPPLRYQGKPMKLRYIIAVSPLLGPFFITFITGTSGMSADRDGHAYRVSSADEKLRWLVCLHMQQCLLQSCCPPACTAALLPCVGP